MFTDDEFAEIRDYMENSSAESRVYLGCDSQKFKKNGDWFARYTSVVIVHIDNCHGGRVFKTSCSEPDYDRNFEKPALRLMNEVYKVVELYGQMEELLIDREFEIHLDVNPNKKYGSSCVVNNAKGYVKGMCGVDAKIKPEAFAASYAADAGVRGRL